MKLTFPVLIQALFLTSAATSFGAVHCVDASSANPVAPFSDWSTAATNIQDAIDASTDNDTVLVTNGVYASGGRVMAGDLTNRVALTKAVTVQSLNGPFVTFIQGAGATNGSSAVRCAWLTNGASLVGFTLQGGATRNTPSFALGYGGGAWCWSASNSIIANCVIRSNTASYFGGGAFQGILSNCLIVQNGKNLLQGGGAAGSVLYNCTIYSNATPAVYASTLTNCIVRFNFSGSSEANSSSSTFAYSDTYPLATGDGNLSADPQFFADGIHLSTGSPCQGAGTNLTSGTDLFGQAWLNPPSMGCVEMPSVPVVTAPAYRLVGAPPGFSVGAVATGQGSLNFFWQKDGVVLQDNAHINGTHTTNLVATGVNDQDAGLYQLVVGYSSGSVTSAPAQVVIHFVDASSISSVLPFTSWATAATTIQDAIDAALPGDIVLVTNGFYATGGRSVSGGLTNRVTLDKPILLASANGWPSTVIQGAWDPISTNGPSAVRCVWMTNGASLTGFTIQNGATLGGVLSWNSPYSGGGVWCGASNGVSPGAANVYVSNCVLTNNSAFAYGGGAAGGTLNNCFIVGNNSTLGYGGGVAFNVLNNCTIIYNTMPSFGGYAAGIYFGSFSEPQTYVRNCIVLYNYNQLTYAFANYNSSGTVNVTSSCTSPLPSGSGNIVVDPQFVDILHIAAASPCRGVGSSLFSSGLDIDGESWSSPPSMGCDEVVDSALIGPLSVGLQAPRQTKSVVNKPLSFVGIITGRASRLSWSFSDGPSVTNAGYEIMHTWTNAGDYPVTFTAYNNDYPDGVSTGLLVHIQALLLPVLTSPAVSNNSFSFQFYGQPNQGYYVLASTNLSIPSTNWQRVAYPYGTDAPVQVNLPYDPNLPAQFFRVQPW